MITIIILMKGKERYNFIKQKKLEGYNYSDIADMVNLKSDTAVRVFMSRNKSKFEIDNNDNKTDNGKEHITLRRTRTKEITFSYIIELAEKTKQKDPHNGEFQRFIDRMIGKDPLKKYGRDAYLLRTVIKLLK